MNARELLLQSAAYLSPNAIIQGLTPDVAERRVTNAPHSIAELVAHLAFWQDWFLARCEGRAEPMPAHAADGWPAVGPGSWPELEARFNAGLARAVGIGERPGAQEAPVTPAIEFPLLAGFRVRDVLEHISQHNAHHLGQVILMRQLLGAWPPPAGSWTW